MYALGYCPSPLGTFTVVASDEGVVAVLWPETVSVFGQMSKWMPNHPMVIRAIEQLQSYFARQRQRFDLPLVYQGTPFQQRVWQQLLFIPYGQTSTYGELARELGDVKLARAVGSANSRNPWAIVTPCHRVVGKSGQLTGFAGGLAAKAWLLRFEEESDGLAE